MWWPKWRTWSNRESSSPIRCLRREFLWMRFFRARRMRNGLKSASHEGRDLMPLTDEQKRERIARRIARELRDGFCVNLGIGMPTAVANYVPKGMDVILQSV